jgi:hypothetical protein
MSCTQCGAQIHEGQRFCGNCGARVIDSETARPDPTADSDPTSADRPEWPTPATAKASSGVNRSVIVAAVVALLVIAAGAGIYFGTDLLRPSAKENIPSPDELAGRSPEPVEEPPSMSPPEPEVPRSKSQSTRKTPPASAKRPSPSVASRRTAAAGTYETVRDTSVFESPSASSKVVGSIPRGYTVEVVGSTGSWLEVRSRSGNPPGFIRRNDALPATKRG